MGEVVSERWDAAASARPDIGSGSERAAKRHALELVAVRGREVIGVKHLMDGACANIGSVADSIARIPMTEFGGRPALLAEATARRAVIHLPPRARARMHGTDGLGRLAIGPCDIEVRTGDKVVLVFGALQVRAQIVPVDGTARRFALPAGAATWIALVGGVYLAALAICATVAPGASHLHAGALRAAASHFLPQLAAR